ncbi:YfmQ family protein [Bacillus sp. 165]|uniref:YfmQ family protein n=1 Tax=Bacillus sp. 165 TaxID=1529117 RepID=UPI001ADAA829|nr:YfmQ family protein [Bacillus sp. 165]MBO9129271.1 hypothetical protein [Bacillus sp. 165]
MTWEVLVPMILISIVKILMTSLPNSTVRWLISKFEIHSKLRDEDTIVTFEGKHLEGEDKIQVMNYFNEAIFLKRYYIFSGNEHLYLQPENSGTPLIIDTKREKKVVRLFVFIYNDHVDVVKQCKKKVVAYKLLSDNLQKTSYVCKRDLA